MSVCAAVTYFCFLQRNHKNTFLPKMANRADNSSVIATLGSALEAHADWASYCIFALEFIAIFLVVVNIWSRERKRLFVVQLVVAFPFFLRHAIVVKAGEGILS